MFITFEGVDGSGKTTQVEFLADHLRALGRKVVVTREPGGTKLGERIRGLVLHGDSMTPWAEASLFTAARAQLVDEVIRPALAGGADVIADRYVDSSLAYQGLARGLGAERVLEMNMLATGRLLPDRTFYLRVTPITAARRRGQDLDRFEAEGAEFAAEVVRAYNELPKIVGDRYVVIDGTKQPTEVAQDVREELRELS